MTRLLEILISFAIVAVLFVAVGLVLPSSRHLSHSVETNRKLTIVYDTLNSFRRFPQWNPLVLRDPTAELKLTGPTEGVGATIVFESDEDDVGDGFWRIIETDPLKRVVYAIENEEPGDDKVTAFTLQRVGRGGRNVEITQTYDVDYGWNLIGRYYGLYVSSGFGEDMKLGLARLSNMLAGVPNVDYASLQREYKSPAPKIVDRPGETLLVVSATVPNDFEKIESQMEGNREWIRKVIEANNLESAGPLRVITTEAGSANYTFDVAVPVRAAGGGPVTGDIDVQGPVTVVKTEPRKVVTTTFKGHMANLSKLRDALRAWAMTHGYSVVDRPYEDWTTGIESGFGEEGEYVVQWAVK